MLLCLNSSRARAGSRELQLQLRAECYKKLDGSTADFLQHAEEFANAKHESYGKEFAKQITVTVKDARVAGRGRALAPS